MAPPDFPELWTPTIIAVMGLFHTIERWELDLKLARWAKCPLLKHQIVLDTLSKNGGFDHNSNPSEDEAEKLQLVASDVVSEMAFSQLSYSTSECVVMNSLISYKSQLSQLMNKLKDHTGAVIRPRLLIIECKRKNKFLWQRDVEDALGRTDNRIKWYDPKNWKDVEIAVDKCRDECWDDYFVTFAKNDLSVDTMKLVIDTNEDLNDRDLVAGEKTSRRSHFMEAIRDLLTSASHKYRVQNYVVDYAVWRRQRLEELGKSMSSRVATLHYWCYPGDCIFRFTKNPEVKHEAICEICEGKISNTERAYYCQFCSLSFHKSCGEFTLDDHDKKINFVHSRVVDSYAKGSVGSFPFPKTHVCYKCIEEEEEDFCDDCSFCIFRTHLKCRLLPTVLRHICDKRHILSINLSWSNPDTYYCRACGLESLWSNYSCNICRSEYHMECLHLPLRLENEHGGHLHSMKVEFSCFKEDEYEWCNVCYKDIDPEKWVYTCLDCDHVAHLYCIFPIISERYEDQT